MLTDTQLNALLKQNIAQLAPVESIDLNFDPGKVRARVRVSGMDLQVVTGARLVNGRVTLVDPVVTGPMGMTLPAEGFIGPIEKILNEQLTKNGITIKSFEIREGVIVIG
ncbi:MAG: hypothetical protein KGS47_04290 [Chloroflexi bacterium]|jgi:hypothetical protein|nr:hypothetical protein [Chloroflexota bacterium]